MDLGDREDRIEDREVSSAPTQETYQDTLDRFLENSAHMPREATPEARKSELSSEQFKLRKAFLLLARDQCRENGLMPGSREALDIFVDADDRANKIIYAYAGLPFQTEEMLALTPQEIKERLALTVPPYVDNLVPHVQKHRKLGALPEDLSFGVGGYVTGRLKSPEIDRLLLQALTQVEIVSFIHEMIGENPATGTSKLQDAVPRSVIRTVWNVSKLIFLVWILSIGIAASPLLITALPQDSMLLFGLGLGGLGTLALLVLGVFGIIAVIQERPRRRKIHQSILDMIDRMNGLYMEFRGSGPFSLSHFKKRVNELADTGVVWPSGLFVLIEDMEERGIRTF